MKKTGFGQILRSACVGGWLTAGLFVAVDMGVWAQESLGMVAYDGMSLDAVPNGTALGAANPDEGESPVGKLSDEDKTNYTQIEFIEFTRGGKQWIDTGVAAKTGVKVEARVLWTAEDQDSAFIGARKDSNDTRFLPIQYFNGTLAYGHKTWNRLSEAEVPANSAVDIVSDFTTAGQATIKVGNGEYKVTDLGDAFDTGLTMYLGAGNYGGSASWGMQGRVYSCKIYEGNELKRDFVPVVKNTDGLYGLFDLKGRTFYPMKTPSVEQSVALVEDKETLNNPYVSPGIVLQHNHRYHVTEDTTVDASSMPGVSAIRVPIGAAVIIDIADGKTLTVTGGPGYGRISGGAGIEVPRGSKLVVTGSGTLNATGGAAAAGGRGYGGMGGQFSYIQMTGELDPKHHPLANTKGEYPGDVTNNTVKASDFAKDPLFFGRTGDGGDGGDGGGGAGAGIGTRGGDGGLGGVGPLTKFVIGGKYYEDDKTRYEKFSRFLGMTISDWYLYEEGKNMRYDGPDGGDGGDGGSALSCGEIIIAGSVKVKASSGASGAGGDNGPFGSTALAYDKGVNGGGVSKTYQSQVVNMTGFVGGGGRNRRWNLWYDHEVRRFRCQVGRRH